MIPDRLASAAALHRLGRLAAALWRDLQMRVAILGVRLSSDRTALDALLQGEELPGEWVQRREWRWPVGLTRDSDAARRARRAKLVAAARQFELVGTETWVTVSAVPMASAEDAEYSLETVWEPPWVHPGALTQADVEVSPPTAAGEHARAFLVNTTHENGPRRTLFYVVWHEAEAVLFAIALAAPTEYDLLAAMSMLIEVQRNGAANGR